MARPDPTSDAYLANARRLARIASKAEDDINRAFLLERMEEQYILAIQELDGTRRAREALEVRAELEQSRRRSGRRPPRIEPLLAEGSQFRSALDDLASSNRVGQFFNGTDNVDDVVFIAKKWMGRDGRLTAAESAVRAATCMLWRAGREEETVHLYDEFTNIYMVDVLARIDGANSLSLAEPRARIASQRLRLTGRKHEARQLLAIVTEARDTDSGD